MNANPSSGQGVVDELLALTDSNRIPANRSSAELVGAMLVKVAELLAEHPPYPVIVGVSGAQGSGKSTISEFFALALAQRHAKSTAILSLDDFYLTRRERAVLAAQVHPLCATRGVPGTHDVPLLLETISRLLVAGPTEHVRWPVFDKLADDRAPDERSNERIGRPDVIIIEGWCVALPADRVPLWSGPINALEAEADPSGTWFAWSRDGLARHYSVLWKLLDLTVGIRLPDIETVVRSRLLQEQRMAAAQPGTPVMDEAAVRRFVSHYERYTLALWDALPAIADIIALRDADFVYRLST